MREDAAMRRQREEEEIRREYARMREEAAQLERIRQQQLAIVERARLQRERTRLFDEQVQQVMSVLSRTQEFDDQQRTYPGHTEPPPWPW